MSSTQNQFRTRTVTPPEKIKREWHIIDAKGLVLGRISTKAAQLLSGRRKVSWSPQQDIGDHVIVINATEVTVTGNKASQREYFRHSGYIGNLKSETLGDLMERRPTEVIRRSVMGMLPRTRQRQHMIKRLHIYKDASHPYTDQLTSK